MGRKSGRNPATSQRKKWQRKLQRSAARKGIRSEKRLRVVIDTNVWYSAILYGGNAEKVVDICLACTEVCLSSQILDELFETLKIKNDAPYKWRRHLRLLIEKRCSVVETIDDTLHVRGPKDEHVVSAAVELGADMIITGDMDLLVLRGIYDIAVVTPADFLEYSM